MEYAEVEAGRSWLGLVRPGEAASRCVITYDTSSANTLDCVFLAGSTGLSRVGLSSIGAGALGTTGDNSGVIQNPLTISSLPNTLGRTYGMGTVARPAYITPTGEVAVSGTGYLLAGAAVPQLCYTAQDTFYSSAFAVCTAVVAPGVSTVVDPSPTLSRSLHALEARQQILNVRQVQALERQLRALLSDERELEEAGLSISLASLHGLIDFLANSADKVHPNLSIARGGYFAA